LNHLNDNRLIQALRQRVLFLDGAMGTATHSIDLDLEADYLGKENCTEVLNLTRPDVVQQIHESFLEVGCDAVESNTFGAMPHVLCEYELADRSREINRKAVEIARAACAAHATPDKPRFVFGSMGPGTKLLTLGQIDWPAMLASYAEQALGLLEAPFGQRADALLVETCQDLLQAKCAVNACVDAQRQLGLWETEQQVPIFVQVTMETTGTMLVGSEIGAAVATLRQLPVSGIGMNCATGPAEMREHVHYLSQHSDKMITILPNAGLPVLVDGQTSFPLQPEGFAAALKQFIDEEGVNIAGGCCGTTPAHLRALVEAVGTTAPKQRKPQTPAQCASLYSAVDLKQETSILMVGERTNANGSRKFKQMLADDDWDGLVSWARGEVRGGAHVLDVCVDYVGRDGVADMSQVVSRYAKQISVPLMLDSTETDVLEAGLQRAPGKCIVNSINLEDGEERLNQVCPLLHRYGAAVVALTIDEDKQAGMAKTAQRKLEIAERLHDLCVNKWQLDERDILFDPLTFTIATGNEDDRRLGLETLEGIRLIAERLPECGILLGLSNISFGLKPNARQVLNSVFLQEAIDRGLTAAILHPSKILPQHKIPAEQWDAAQWLIFDRRGNDRPDGKPENFDPLMHFIGLFPDEDQAAEKKTRRTDLSIEEILQNHIIDGEKQDLNEHLDQALKQYEPLAIINEHLLAGMKVVGELFGSGKMQLPFVLQSAEVMKQAVAYLEPHMERADNETRGRIVLATVKGDVHDIGKNLVDIILTNNGYTVYNIGIKQPVQAIMDAAREHDAHAVGMSGLLVKSVAIMRENLDVMNDNDFDIPLLVGGAALTRHYAETELRDAYEGSLYYGRDAFEALHLMDAICTGQTESLDDEITQRLTKRAESEKKIAAARGGGDSSQAEGGAAASATRTRPQSVVEPASDIPRAPFQGDRLVEEVPLRQIAPYLNKVALFRGQWGFKKGSADNEQYQQQIAEEVEPILQRLLEQCEREDILKPRVVYGYYPVNSDGDDLVVFDPDDPQSEVERFSFPRQSSRQRLCISDFFLPLDAGERDVLGMFCVTMGPEVTRRARALFESNQYTEYLYLHGLGVECAEALAEMWHKRMRQELGIDKEDATEMRKLFAQGYRGSRYSFGYPACPEMSDQEKLFRLLRPDRIGCTLTDNWQIDPEQSTSAIVVHHPKAKYFNV
jgi:5-methyltetrahydrofolate--homocysteine methyltransferase